MSMQHWKNSTVLQPELAKHFPTIMQYAKERNKVVTIFDLEATTFLGRPNFGITEIGMVHITPSGNIGVSGSLVNPERSISKEVTELTGITNAMVKNLQNWKELWLDAISYIADKHIVIGFNSTSFDSKALIHMHNKFSTEELELKEHMDLRTIVNRILGTQKGKLPEIAAHFKIDISEFEGHRATNDALLTAKILDVVMSEHPNFEQYLKPVKKDNKPAVSKTNNGDKKEESKEKKSASPYKSSIQTLLINTFVTASSFKSDMLKPLADVLHIQFPEKTCEQLVTALSFELGTLMDNGTIPFLPPENKDKQDWLESDIFKKLVEAAWSDPSKKNKLAPALEMTDASKLNEVFDYTDIRWGLSYHGLRSAKIANTDNVPTP